MSTGSLVWRCSVSFSLMSVLLANGGSCANDVRGAVSQSDPVAVGGADGHPGGETLFDAGPDEPGSVRRRAVHHLEASGDGTHEHVGLGERAASVCDPDRPCTGVVCGVRVAPEEDRSGDGDALA